MRPERSGKSTLLRCINRLVEPTAGESCLTISTSTGGHGGDLRKIRRSGGMIFQQFTWSNARPC